MKTFAQITNVSTLLEIVNELLAEGTLSSDRLESELINMGVLEQTQQALLQLDETFMELLDNIDYQE